MEGLVYRDLAFGMISKHPKDAPKRYRSFVEGAIGADLDDPKKAVFGGMILGSPIFIKEALGRLKDVAFHQEEISQFRDDRRLQRMVKEVMSHVKN